MPYRHTHIGYFLIVALGIGLLFLLGRPWSYIGVLLLVVFIWLSRNQTIEIINNSLVWHSCLGLIRRKIPLAEIECVLVLGFPGQGESKRHGAQGERLFTLPKLLDTVEISLQSGRTIRLATDQPEELARAIATMRSESTTANRECSPMHVTEEAETNI